MIDFIFSVFWRYFSFDFSQPLFLMGLVLFPELNVSLFFGYFQDFLVIRSLIRLPLCLSSFKIMKPFWSFCYCCPLNLGNICPLFVWILFFTSFSLLVFWGSNYTCIRSLGIVLFETLTICFNLFFSLFFILNKYYWSSNIIDLYSSWTVLPHPSLNISVYC